MDGRRRAASADQSQSVCRLLDRQHMLRQRSVVMAQHERTVGRRIEQREISELEREKQLILAGKMVVEDAPYIADHPVFKVSKMTTGVLEETRKAVAEKLKPKLSKGPDYDQMRSASCPLVVGGGGGGGQEDRGDDSLMELDAEELERARKLWEIGRRIEHGEIFSQEDYDKVMYEDPLIKRMRSAESVAELYHLAEELIGPVTVFTKPRKRHG